jgi:hypothetical protein
MADATPESSQAAPAQSESVANPIQSFTTHHAGQYKVLSDDMRYFADQRFKILTAFLLTSGFLANVVKDNPNPMLCVPGIVLAYLCFSWELSTTRWWGTLIEQCKRLEELALKDKAMIPAYLKYREQIPESGLQRVPHPRPSNAVAWVYIGTALTWLLVALYQMAC